MVSKNTARVLVQLGEYGPQTMTGLQTALGIKPDSLNRILESLLEAGHIERCAIGQFGGVRIKTEESQGRLN